MKQLVRWLARALGRDKRPLLRRSDRIEVAIMTGLVGILLVVGPVLGVIAGRAAARSDGGQLIAERSWHQVPATVLRAEQPDGWVSPGLVVRWTAPDGQRRTGAVPAVTLAGAGQHVQIWVDGAGRLAYLPMARWQVYRDVALDASALLVSLG